MHKYAQIGVDTGYCVSISILAREVEADHMIPLLDDTDVQPGDIYVDGEWSRPDTEPSLMTGMTADERITQLEAENAGLALELAKNQIRFVKLEQANTDLLLSLVDKGII